MKLRMLQNQAEQCAEPRLAKAALQPILLHESFPLSTWWMLRKVFGWTTLLLLSLMAAVLWSPELFSVSHPDEFVVLSLFAQKKFVFVVGATLVLVAKIVQMKLLRANFRLELDGKRLTIRRGIFRREWGSIPLTQFTEFYVRQNVLDMLLGIAALEVTVPSRRQDRGLIIPGLSLQSAKQLKRTLERALDSTQGTSSPEPVTKLRSVK